MFSLAYAKVENFRNRAKYSYFLTILFVLVVAEFPAVFEVSKICDVSESPRPHKNKCSVLFAYEYVTTAESWIQRRPPVSLFLNASVEHRVNNFCRIPFKDRGCDRVCAVTATSRHLI